MPAPRSWTRMRDARRGSGPGSTNSRLMPSGTCCAERRARSTACDVVDARRRVCGLPMSTVARPGASGRTPTAGQPAGARRPGVTAPMSTRGHDARRGSSVGVDARRERSPASVRDRARAPGRRRGRRAGLGEAADAVAAHLGPAAVGVVAAPSRRRRRPPVGGRRRARRPSAPMPRRRSHSRAGQRRRRPSGAPSIVEQRRGSRCRGRGAWSACTRGQSSQRQHDGSGRGDRHRARRRPSVCAGRGGTIAPGGRRTAGCGR